MPTPSIATAAARLREAVDALAQCINASKALQGTGQYSALVKAANARGNALRHRDQCSLDLLAAVEAVLARAQQGPDDAPRHMGLAERTAYESGWWSGQGEGYAAGLAARVPDAAVDAGRVAWRPDRMRGDGYGHVADLGGARIAAWKSGGGFAWAVFAGGPNTIGKAPDEPAARQAAAEAAAQLARDVLAALAPEAAPEAAP